jgi:hypothetical protein
VLFTCLFTLVVGGGIADRLLVRWGLVGGGHSHSVPVRVEDTEDDLTLYGGASKLPAIDLDRDSADQSPLYTRDQGRCSLWWGRVDRDCLRPLFGGRGTDRTFRLDAEGDPIPYRPATLSTPQYRSFLLLLLLFLLPLLFSYTTFVAIIPPPYHPPPPPSPSPPGTRMSPIAPATAQGTHMGEGGGGSI